MTSSASLPREIAFSKRPQPLVDPALKDRAKASLRRWVGIAQQRFGAKAYAPTISFDMIGKKAGRAYWRSRHIQLNHILLLENFEQFDQAIIPHELSHLICRNIYGKTVLSHGDEWKAIMRALGVEPDRTHSLDTTNSRTTAKVFGYVCGCNLNNFLSTLKHKRSCSGTVYGCPKCKQPMIFTPPAAHA